MKPEPERDEGDGRHAPGTVAAASAPELEDRARAILAAAWRPDGDAGYCVPNATTYPWQWLWDSCFHAVVWAHLGDERAGLELASALADQDEHGFVPHVRYGTGPNPHQAFWGRATTSSITQPPMYGHAAAVVARSGLPLGGDVVDRAGRGLRFLLQRRRRSPGGLVELCHPWESGCDDSPRWDDLVAGPWSVETWFDVKGALLTTVERSSSGAPLANPACAVGSVAFTALVAWNARELAALTGEDDLASAATELAEAVDARWDPDLVTWVDDGPTARGSGRVRTHDALLPSLVVDRPEARAALTDPAALGAPFGPTGVHRAEPSFDPTGYWRGGAWPQLAYLSWRAAAAAGDEGTASSLRRSLTAAVLRSGFAELWDPDTAAPLGAVPQTWSTLAAVVASSAGPSG